MKYEIESNVPLGDHTGGHPAKYPFGRMKVGDSFMADHDRARKAAYVFAHRVGVKFATKKVAGGIRIWRVS